MLLRELKCGVESSERAAAARSALSGALFPAALPTQRVDHYLRSVVVRELRARVLTVVFCCSMHSALYTSTVLLQQYKSYSY